MNFYFDRLSDDGREIDVWTVVWLSADGRAHCGAVRCGTLSVLWIARQMWI